MEGAAEQENRKGRLELLDTVRGFTMISMTLYHGVWDLVYIRGFSMPWYRGQAAFIWQQSICWTFILLSGFCLPFSKRPFRRGLQVFGGGLIVSAATLLLMPQDRVVFGVLTFIGSAMLLTAALKEPVLSRIPAAGGLIPSMLLFVFTYGVNAGGFGVFRRILLPLPPQLYSGYLMTFLGFTDPTFYSTDYFSLIPWLFLFLTGYYLNGCMTKAGVLRRPVMRRGVPVLSALGRHSLLYYLLHQVILYLALVLLPSALLS